MVRYLIKHGTKIKLLPPPDTPEICRKCGMTFDTATHRRVCIELCGHVVCLWCMDKRLNLKEGCDQCTASSSSSQANVKFKDKIEQKYTEGPPNFGKEAQQVIVLSSKLTKEENGEDFPEIETLSLSELPVLEKAGEYPDPVTCHEKPDKLRRETTEKAEYELEESDTEDSSMEDSEDFESDEYDVDEPGQYATFIPVNDDEFISQSKANSDSKPAELIDITGDDEVLCIDLASDEESDQQEIENEKETDIIKDRKFEEEQNLDPGFASAEDFDIDTLDKENEVTIETTLQNLPKNSNRKSVQKPTRTPRRSHKSNGNGKYVCQYCHDSFSERPALGVHLFQAHSDIRPYPCTQCKWPFDSARNLEMHMLTHTNERPFKCTLCTGAFNRNFTLRKHMDKIHGVKLPKKQRGKGIQRTNSSEQSSEKENRKERKEKRKPKTLKRRYTRRKSKPDFEETAGETDYWEDLFEWDEGYAKRAKTILNCLMCEETFPRKYSLERHMEHDHGIRVKMRPEETLPGDEYCPECQSLFEKEKCVKVAYIECGHISCVDCVKRAELGCGQCTTETAHKEVVDEDETKNESEEEIDIPMGKKISDETIANMDIIENLEMDPPEDDRFMDSPEPALRTYKCKYCTFNIEYTDRKDLQNHMRAAHSNKLPYPCGICDYSYPTYYELKRHLLTHNTVKPFKCYICKESFTKDSARAAHITKQHLNSKKQK